MSMSIVTPYKLTDTEVLASATTCVVIDETGTPGQDIGSKYLHPTRKTWVAVVLIPSEFAIASTELPLALKELEKLCGGKEFHLTDIYRGHKTFKGVPPEKRLAVIAFLAHIFNEHRYPILVRTLDDVEAKKFSDQKFQRKHGALDLRKSDELALWMLLHHVQDFLLDTNRAIKYPAYVVMDEGQWKNDRSINVRGTISDPTAFIGEKIYSQNSQNFPCLQLADFAAFCINRQQWLMASEKKTDFDITFLHIISDANLNTINIPQRKVDLNLWLSSDYDLLRTVIDESKGIRGR